MAAFAPRSIPPRDSLDRWEAEAVSSASMTTWKDRFLVAMGWLRDAEEAAVPEGFSDAEAVVLDTVIAHAMGGSATVSKTNPELAKIRRKTMAMKKKATA